MAEPMPVDQEVINVSGVSTRFGEHVVHIDIDGKRRQRFFRDALKAVLGDGGVGFGVGLGFRMSSG